MSHHVQFESNMSLTGANADRRNPMSPAQQKVALAQLYARLNGSSLGGDLTEAASRALDSLVSRIAANRARTLVVCGLEDDNA